MAQHPHPRRFYIDRQNDHAVVRAVPVRQTPPSAASHQLETVSSGTSLDTNPFRGPSASEPSHRSVRASVASRLAPARVGRLVQSARKRPDRSTS